MPTISAYDEIADWYDAWVAPTMKEDDFFAPVEALMGEVAGRRICDFACGQGRVARYLADLGAQVVGVDLSAKLLEIAQRHEEAEPRGITYLQADVQKVSDSEIGSFDGVICYLALMDIPELAPTLQSVAQILRPGGWFVLSILHPCYNTSQSGEIVSPEGVVRTVASYFTEGFWRSDYPLGVRGKVGSYHRTLSSYLNALLDAGFVLESLHEARATESVAKARPVWVEVPAVLTARCVKRMR